MTAPNRCRQVRVTEVIDETDDARSLVLQVAPEFADEFTYLPGQFLTVRVPGVRGNGAADGSVGRCYSLSSSPGIDDQLKITVKRIPGGHASNWICDHIASGAVLDVLPPAGRFTPRHLDHDVVLLAAGSGITPVVSILKAVLSRGRGGVLLIYANRDESSVIFAQELKQLQAAHPDRLHIEHWFDSVQGPPTEAGLCRLIGPRADRDAFICGPQPYMDVAGHALRQLGTPAARIHVERFQSLPENPFATATADSDTASGEGDERAVVVAASDSPEEQPAQATAVVALDGQVHRLAWPAQTRLLDVLIDAGLNPPYSCRQGICGACACRIIDGEVEMVHNEVLEDEDFTEGYTLACQALPRSEIVEITYS